LTFLIPSGLPVEATSELERACMAGGQDNMPYTTTVAVDPGQLLVNRKADESGYLVAPWLVDGAGLMMTSTATVIERPQPYQLVQAYVAQVFQVRRQRQPRLDTHLSIRLGTTPPPDGLVEPFAEACNAVTIPFTWADIEPAEADYRWAPFDAMLQWAEHNRKP